MVQDSLRLPVSPTDSSQTVTCGIFSCSTSSTASTVYCPHCVPTVSPLCTVQTVTMLGGAVCDSTNHTLGVVQVLNKEGAGGEVHETGGWPVFDENDEVRRRAE